MSQHKQPCGGYCQVILVEARCGSGEVVSSDSAGARHLAPNPERSISQRAVIGGTHEVTTNPEQVLDDTVNGEEALRLTRRFEPAHLSLALPSRLVRDLRTVVRVLCRIVDD